MRDRPKIVVCSGRPIETGTLSTELRDSFRGAALQYVRVEQLADPGVLNDDVLALFLPGVSGDRSPYRAGLRGWGNAAIRRYVARGGVYAGVCAGAYQACRSVLYAAPWMRVPQEERPGLNFFNALAQGPIPGGACYDGPEIGSGLCAVSVSFRTEDGIERRGAIAYGNGPALFPCDGGDGTEIIARYDNVPGKPGAVAVKEVGDGLVFFIGVLPYTRFDPRLENSPHLLLRQFMAALQPHEEVRRALWDRIVFRIKTHNAALGKVTLFPRQRALA